MTAFGDIREFGHQRSVARGVEFRRHINQYFNSSNLKRCRIQYCCLAVSDIKPRVKLGNGQFIKCWIIPYIPTVKQ